MQDSKVLNRPIPMSVHIRQLPLRWSLILSALAMIALTLVMTPLQPEQKGATISLLYVLLIVAIAASGGLWPAILAAVMAALAFNYFFMVPHHAFGILSFEDGERLLIFVGVAVLSGSLAARARNQALASMRQATELNALYRLSQMISAEVSLNRIAAIVAETTVQLLNLASCTIFVVEEDSQLIELAQVGTPSAEQIDISLRTEHRPHIVFRVSPQDERHLSPADYSLIETVTAQMMRAVERSHLAQALASVQALDQSDRLKSTLLSSVSHDLRTPLTVIKGAVTNLLDHGVEWDRESHDDLLNEIDEETDRLNRLVGHLLEMSQIEAGSLQQTRSWQEPCEVLMTVVNRLRPRIPQHPLQLDVAPQLPLIHINYVQIDHVLTNIIENAASYAPPDTPIEIRVFHPAERRADVADELLVEYVQFEILDRGPGVPLSIRDRLFEKFVRGVGPELSAKGSGLGLAICKGLIEAHHGKIWVSDRLGGGACFSFILPVMYPQTSGNLYG